MIMFPRPVACMIDIWFVLECLMPLLMPSFFTIKKS